MHVWLPDIRVRQTPDWPAHTHNSRFESVIVAGFVEAFFWDFEEKSGDNSCLYEVHYDDETSILRRTNVTGAASIRSSIIVKEQDSYVVEPHRFHSTEVPSELSAVSIVVQDTREFGISRVIGGSRGDSEYRFCREGIGSEELDSVRNLVRSVIDRMRSYS